MDITSFKDSSGNSVRLSRALPQWGLVVEVTSTTGVSTRVELAGEALQEFAAAVQDALAASLKYAK
jgi:hypothetical protein